MYKNKKVVVVMPAYNAEETLRMTHQEVMDQGIVDMVIVVDDASSDQTSTVAKDLPQTIIHTHIQNQGYGGNQKSCYRLALEHNADIVIMVHPDYQYTPKLIPSMASMIGNGLYHCVLGSRILGGYALKGGMPPWRYAANRFLTLANIVQPSIECFDLRTQDNIMTNYNKLLWVKTRRSLFTVVNRVLAVWQQR